MAESIASPDSVWTPPSQRKGNRVIPASPTKTTPDSKSVADVDFYGAPVAKLKPVSPEDFYAPRSTLVIDNLSNRSRKLSVEVKPYGVNKRRRSTSRSASRSRKRQKGSIPGVWHGIKKPKKMNKHAPKPKPSVSPLNRIEKLNEIAEKPVKKGRRLFTENPRKRISDGKSCSDDESSIIGKLLKFLPLLKLK